MPTNSTEEGNPIPSLGSFVRGKDTESGNWVYATSPRAVLDDSFASLRLKRRLESGAISLDEVPPGVVVGRVSLADKATLQSALSAAAEATQIWRSAPLSVRLQDWMALLRAALAQE